MSDKTGIAWTDAAAMIDRNGTRVRHYQRKCPERPGTQLRRKKKAEGLRWCRGCLDWLPERKVTKNGVCRYHANEEYRANYHAGGKTKIAARVHARKRGIGVVPKIAIEYLTDIFDGLCAYCNEPAATNDHIEPVANGGQTQPGNIVPACVSCNSSKNAKEVFAWLNNTGRCLNNSFECIWLLGII